MRIPGGSSMGMPVEMKANIQKYEMEKKMKEEEYFNNGKSQDEEVKSALPKESIDNGYELKEETAEINPVDALKDIGITLTENDLHSLLFKGGLEKDAVIAKRGDNVLMTATLKTLNAKEVSLIDSILADDISKVKMTGHGFEGRRTLLTLSFGVVKLNNKFIAKGQVLDNEGKPDLKEMAFQRLEAFLELSAVVVDKIAKAHGRFAIACGMILENPDSPLLQGPSEAPKA